MALLIYSACVFNVVGKTDWCDRVSQSRLVQNEARQQAFCFVSGQDFSRAVKAQKRVGL
jgi:hypothetical protein